MHYCMDRLVSRGMQKNDDQSCSSCGMKKDVAKGCCKDEHKQVKLQSDQNTVEAFLLPVYFSADVDIIPFIPYQPALYISQSFRLPYGNAPPDKGGRSLYLRNNVFRI